MKVNQKIPTDRIIGLGLILVGLVFSFQLISRFYNQVPIDGIIHGVIYESNITLDEWLPTILYSNLLIISGLLVFIKDSIENLLLFYTLIGIIIDRVLGFVIFKYEFFYGLVVDFLIPIILVLTLLIHMTVKVEKAKKNNFINYILAILIGCIVTLISNKFFTGII